MINYVTKYAYRMKKDWFMIKASSKQSKQTCYLCTDLRQSGTWKARHVHKIHRSTEPKPVLARNRRSTMNRTKRHASFVSIVDEVMNFTGKNSVYFRIVIDSLRVVYFVSVSNRAKLFTIYQIHENANSSHKRLIATKMTNSSIICISYSAER